MSAETGNILWNKNVVLGTRTDGQQILKAGYGIQDYSVLKKVDGEEKIVGPLWSRFDFEPRTHCRTVKIQQGNFLDVITDGNGYILRHLDYNVLDPEMYIVERVEAGKQGSSVFHSVGETFVYFAGENGLTMFQLVTPELETNSEIGLDVPPKEVVGGALARGETDKIWQFWRDYHILQGIEATFNKEDTARRVAEMSHTR